MDYRHTHTHTDTHRHKNTKTQKNTAIVTKKEKKEETASKCVDQDSTSASPTALGGDLQISILTGNTSAHPVRNASAWGISPAYSHLIQGRAKAATPATSVSRDGESAGEKGRSP